MNSTWLTITKQSICKLHDAYSYVYVNASHTSNVCQHIRPTYDISLPTCPTYALSLLTCPMCVKTVKHASHACQHIRIQYTHKAAHTSHVCQHHCVQEVAHTSHVYQHHRVNIRTHAHAHIHTTHAFSLTWLMKHDKDITWAFIESSLSHCSHYVNLHNLYQVSHLDI